MILINATGTIDTGTIAVVKYLVSYINFVIFTGISIATIYWYRNR